MRLRFLFPNVILVTALVAAACGTGSSNESGNDAAPTAADEAAEAPRSFGPADDLADALTTASQCQADGIACIGLVTATGAAADALDARSAWSAIQDLETSTVQVNRIDTTDPSRMAANIDRFAREGYDVVVTVGSAIAEPTAEAASANPHVAFIGLDQHHASGQSNLAGVVFPADHAGALVGALAAHLTDSKVVGLVLGSELMLAESTFAEGFTAGAAEVDGSVRVRTRFHPGGLHEVNRDPEWGAEAANQLINAGADVVVARDNPTGQGAFLAAAEAGVSCLGADLDLAQLAAPAEQCVVATAWGQAEDATYDLVRLALNAELPAGVQVGDIDIAPNLGAERSISAAAMAEVDRLGEQLRSGVVGEPEPVDG